MLSLLNIILATLIGAASWTSYRFGQVNIEQLLSTIFMGGGGLFTSDARLIIELIVVLLLSAALLLFFQKKIIKGKLLEYFFLSALSVTTILIVNATIQSAPAKISNIKDHHISETNFTNYSDQKAPNKNITNIYIPVSLDRITSPPQKKRNLVLIYVESLETSYRDINLFNKNLLSDLDLIKGAEFTNYEQIFGTGWTMGAIVATQCGVPLRPSQDVIKFFKQDGLNGNTLGESKDVFMKGFICLGDILKNHGYTNVFLGGASGRFSGKDKFFKGHGYEQTYGKEEWVALGEKSLNDWGLYDDQLFENAKTKLNELNSRNIPFNLTLLTVDTHHPNGFVSQKCKTFFPNANFENIIECTSKLVSEFINYILVKHPNIDIVVLGDHLAMINPVYHKLETHANRTIYNKFIFNRQLEKNREKIHHYSILPTILYGMGFEFKDGALALGQTGLQSKTSTVVLKNVEMNDDDSTIINKLYKNAWDR
jgi:phosphoglycerol transferase